MEKSNRLYCVNIRGTSGSGKTSIVRHILKHSYGGFTPITDERKTILYLNEKLHWAVIGSYANECGGCDTIKTQDEVQDRIRKCLNNGYNVLFEGLVLSTITGRWLEFSKEISDRADLLFYYLNTPIEECVRRVKLRREQAGNMKEFNTSNTVERVKAIEGTKQKLKAAECYVLEGSQEDCLNGLHSWFGLGEYVSK